MGTPIWHPNLAPQFLTLILGPQFGTPIYDLDLGHPYFGPPFWTPILDPDL
jgi:hypothetical protein